MDDIHLKTFFLTNPIAKILYTIMDGSYRNPDYEKYLEDKKEISASEFFKKNYSK